MSAAETGHQPEFESDPLHSRTMEAMMGIGGFALAAEGIISVVADHYYGQGIGYTATGLFMMAMSRVVRYGRNHSGQQG